MKRLLCLVAVMAIAASCSPSTTSSDSIKFSHYVHSEQGMECSECHGDVLKDREQVVDAIPGKPACADCHDVEEAEECGTCHRNTDDPAKWPTKETGGSTLVFSHQAHEEYGAECEDCHKDAANWPDKAEGKAGEMKHADCASCHKSDLDAGKCAMCHSKLDLSGKPEDFYSHEANFFKRHGVQAKSGADQCARCHDQSYCNECHAKSSPVTNSVRYQEKVGANFVHRGDWMSRHHVEARTGNPGCMKCHGNRFCSDCHEKSGIGPAVGGNNPHPATWLSAGGPGSHSQAAHRRIAECASCHDQGTRSNCVECHSTGGVDPHPPGWNPSNKDEKTTHKMCRICHNQ